MRKLTAFMNVSLDGYFAGPKGELDWSHKGADDAEWKSFVESNAKGGGPLLLGRVTYDLMKSYWPTPIAKQNDPKVAEGMNALPKVVFSRTLDKADWQNTKVVRSDPATEVRGMKQQSGDDLVTLGSGSIVTLLAQAGLIDEFQIVVVPVALGSGKTLLDGMKKPLELKLTSTRTFGNGRVLLCYELRG